MRETTSVCGLKLRKALKGNSSSLRLQGLGVHWQVRERAGIFKGIKWRPALPTPCTLTFERLGKTSYFSWLVPDGGIFSCMGAGDHRVSQQDPG